MHLNKKISEYIIHHHFLVSGYSFPASQSQDHLAHLITSSCSHFWRLWRSKLIKTKWGFCNIICRWLGLDSEENVPEACKKSAFDVLCHQMEQRLTYAPNEQVNYSFQLIQYSNELSLHFVIPCESTAFSFSIIRFSHVWIQYLHSHKGG